MSFALEASGLSASGHSEEPKGVLVCTSPSASLTNSAYNAFRPDPEERSSEFTPQEALEVENFLLQAKLARADGVVQHIRSSLYKELVMLRERVYSRTHAAQLDMEIQSFFDFTLSFLRDTCSMDALDEATVSRLRNQGKVRMLIESEINKNTARLQREFHLSKQDLMNQLGAKSRRIVELTNTLHKANLPQLRVRLQLLWRQVQDARAKCNAMREAAKAAMIEDSAVVAMKTIAFAKIARYEQSARNEGACHEVMGLFTKELAGVFHVVSEQLARSQLQVLSAGNVEIVPAGSHMSFVEKVTTGVSDLKAATSLEAEVRKLSKGLFHVRHYFNVALNQVRELASLTRSPTNVASPHRTTALAVSTQAGDDPRRRTGVDTGTEPSPQLTKGSAACSGLLAQKSRLTQA
eukprot:RCo000207